MKKAYLFSDNDWYCPHCGEINNTENPGKNVQCSWCNKESEASAMDIGENT